MKSSTIAAIASAITNSGIGIIRISGDDAFEIADKVFKPKKGNKSVKDYDTHTIHYGFIVDNEEIIDEVMLLVMAAPNTYTREDTIEIDCHGGSFIMKRILETVLKNGAAPAEPGEFTKRAFLNGRIDLSQAESVIDIINSKNEFSRKNSISQLKGSVKDKISEVRAVILHELAYIETALDDPEHFDLTDYPEELLGKINGEIDKTQKLIDTFNNGRVLKEGINTVIVGKPNVGKSSILNILVGSERAIVTDIAGTTRDILEEQINIGGISLNIVDTAGIRDTEDVVEKIGVSRSKEALKEADLVIYVIDSSVEMDENDTEIISQISEKTNAGRVIVLMNKSDLDGVVTADDVKNKIDAPIISVSAANRTGIEEIERLIKDMFVAGDISFNDEVYITNIRQKDALCEALDSLNMVKNSILDGMPEDFFTIDMMNAYESLGRIIGEAVGEDLVNEIFAKFCMGK